MSPVHLITLSLLFLLTACAAPTPTSSHAPSPTPAISTAPPLPSEASPPAPLPTSSPPVAPTTTPKPQIIFITAGGEQATGYQSVIARAAAEFGWEAQTVQDTAPVELRRLSYHQMMQRRDIASKIGWEERRSAGRNAKQEDTIKAMMEVMSVATMEYEFKHSIVNHNLDDDSGNLLDFQNPESYRNLDPKVGAEIGKYIDSLNQELDEKELENFPTAPKPSYGEETTPPIISDES